VRTTPLLAALALGVSGFGSAPAQGPCTGDAAKTASALYARLLHRKPAALELRSSIRLLKQGRLVVELAHSFTLSQEHRDSLAKLTDPGVVAHLYQDLLNRAVDSAGRAHWLPIYAASGLNAVVHGIQYSDEYQQNWGAARVPGTTASFFCSRDAMPMPRKH